MIAPGSFFEALRGRGINFFTGVPDSLLKDFCAYVTDHCDDSEHVIAANEGGAVALAAGHYLATGSLGLVYMQNSGQGNAVNPLVSLADPEVFGIPMLLLVGWRGEPGTADEPQHVKQGRITCDLFDALEIRHRILPKTEADFLECLDTAIQTARSLEAPFALVVRKGTFGPYKSSSHRRISSALSREAALGMVLEAVGAHDIIVATTGMLSRELFEHRQRTKASHDRDFRTVGSMGHASQIALGIALARSDRDLVCLDGDGALIMHMGSLAIIGSQQPSRFRHIVFNNGAHDSVGGQPTAGFVIAVPRVAEACGYRATYSASTPEELRAVLPALWSGPGPALLEIRVTPGARPDLGRPTTTPAENKRQLMDTLRK